MVTNSSGQSTFQILQGSCSSPKRLVGCLGFSLFLPEFRSKSLYEISYLNLAFNVRFLDRRCRLQFRVKLNT